ncbi:MAG: hypothetical protein GXO88_04180 [Chlorobi bacterium]|nr:hypothetical protein [Chlorobiota bacterium]
MKRIFLSTIIVVLLISSCCKGPYEIATVKVSYPNISTTSYLKAIRTQETNANTFLTDTISLGELNSSNSFSAIIEFGDNPLDYLIYVENTSYSDTISKVAYDRVGCDKHIENFKYIFNGELRTDNELTINE